MIIKVLTLTFIQKNEQLLLGMKKRGFGVGKWNGFGGKVHEGESILQAAKRELREEAGIKAQKLLEVGNLDFVYNDIDTTHKVHFFRVLKYSGEPEETEEMRPGWFSVNKLPFESMWPDDPYWMPFFLRGEKFTGEFIFENDQKIIDHNIELAS